MKKYIEYKHEMSVVDGKRAWINPTPTGKEPVMDEEQAAIINDQFPNSGIKLELAEVNEDAEVETTDHSNGEALQNEAVSANEDAQVDNSTESATEEE